MFALVSYPDGTPVVLAGPCWPFCLFVTLPLILGISGVVSYFMIIDKSRYDLVSKTPQVQYAFLRCHTARRIFISIKKTFASSLYFSFTAPPLL